MKSAVKVWRERDERLKNLDKIGKVVSFTKILESPKGFEDEPYWIVMVEMGQAKRTVGQWVDTIEPEIDMRVKGVLRRLGKPEAKEVLEYGVKWKKL